MDRWANDKYERSLYNPKAENSDPERSRVDYFVFFGKLISYELQNLFIDINFQSPYLASQPMKKCSSKYSLQFAMQPDLHCSTDR